MPPSPTKLLFTWEETTLLQQELLKYKTAFISKYDESAYIRFRGDDLKFADVQNAVVGGWFFSTKKLIVIRSVPKDNHPDNKAPTSEQSKTEERIIKYRNEIPEDHILIFVSYKPDRRTKGTKFFLDHATLKEFPLLNEKELAKKAQELLWTLIDAFTALKLVEYIGVNGWMGTLTQECDKLRHYCEAKNIAQISLEIIHDVCIASQETDAFALADVLFLDTKKSLALIEEESEAKIEPLEFLGRLFWAMKLIIALVDAYDRGIISATEIAKEIGVHHFPIMKRLKDYTTYKTKIETIKSCYGQLLQLNYDLITGGLPVEGFWLEMKRIIANE